MRSGRHDSGGETRLEAGASHNNCNLEVNAREKPSRGVKPEAGSRSDPSWEKADDIVKKQVSARSGPPGYGIRHPRKDSQR